MSVSRFRRWLHLPTVSRLCGHRRAAGFSQTQVDMGILRMVQAGVIPVCYSNVAVEILADNAAPEAEAVYGALWHAVQFLGFLSSAVLFTA